MLVRLLYASRATENSMCTALPSILQTSRSYNASHGITGILCHSDRIYLQVLEGGRDAVNALYSKILRDPRHTDVSILSFEEIGERSFCGWTMGMANLDKINPSILLKYSETPQLNPYQLPGHVSLALLLELNASAAILGRT
jgi:hypothetical protein